MSQNAKPPYEYVWEKDDFSDVVAPPPETPEASVASARRDFVERGLNIVLALNVFATAALVLLVWRGEHTFPKAAFLPLILVALAALKLSGSAFLWVYWKTVDPRLARTTPCRAATLNLIPGVDLVWFFVATAGGIVDGLRTIESLDGNRMQISSPTRLARAYYASCVSAVLFVGWRAFALYFHANGDLGALRRLFSFGTTMFANALAIFGFSTFFREAALLALGLVLMGTTASLRLMLLWKLAELARYANDVRAMVEPHATPEERAREQSRLATLLGVRDADEI